jgi:Na+-translocating ferredoxin:NAD+ oxidoreductase RnfG subunit
VLAHHETQGLGTKVFDQAVLFINKDAVTMDEVDSIAGSTITFNAYRRALTYAFEAFELVR